jgi:hypothetical protein
MTSEVGNCEDLQALETSALNSYAGHVEGWDVTRECEALRGYEIWIVEGPRPGSFFWKGRELLGLTLFHKKGPGGLILLGSKFWARSALAHEIGHAIEDGIGLPRTDKHTKWKSRGLCAAIDAVSPSYQEDCGYD